MITNDYKIIKEFDEEIQVLLEAINTNSEADRDKISAILSLYLGTMQKTSMNSLTESTIQLAQSYTASIEALIVSNKDLAQSSERWAKSLTRATWVLCWVTLAVIFGDKLNTLLEWLGHMIMNKMQWLQP